MLELVLVLLLSQTPPPVSAAAAQRFEAERGPMLQALAAKYGCERPGGRREPLCDVARAERDGTAADLRGRTTLLGLSWTVKRGRGGRVEVGAPRLSALALHKDSLGVWGALTDLVPQNPEERRRFAQLTQDYVALLGGRKAGVELPGCVTALLSEWSKSANHLVERREDAWAFKGAPGALRKVGERWVMVGAPGSGEGLVVSLFVPV